MTCLDMWIICFRLRRHSRTSTTQKKNENPHLTLKELSTGIQQILDTRQDARLLSSPLFPPTVPDVNAVSATRNRAKEPPSPRFRRGALHWAKDCDYLEKSCHSCKRTGHKKGFCRNFNKRRKRNTKKKLRRANQVVVVASTTTSTAPFKRIYRTVTITGTPTRMRLDTGADVTLLSLTEWITIGRLKLLPPLFALRSADNKEIKVRGHFQCNFSIEGHKGRGNCHVADTTSLLGLDWITQVEPLFHNLTGNTICNAVSATTLAKLRSSLTAQLQKRFAAVFAPGLGCWTKSKASLKLKPDATPVFQKARPVSYAVLPRLSQEIGRLVAANVLSPVGHSDWAAPIIVVQKKNGSIRLCANFSTGLNDALDQHQHPLPTPDDIFTKLNE
ncbi:hypothetical protein TELCIR_02545 [Teladorsagia circumcincta]|uniref:Peptidase A2 domain-containing protein n=1 Tax=Teladorsagia circumcincta TaxID=45464 RepID=A0A2G9UYV2_TELCI|nr:hypothetical protein TELCIR_02545 [Teladorsagia circumcincta]